MNPIPAPIQNNEKTNLLIAAVRYAVTGPGYLEHLATEYFQGTEETEMVNSIFDKAATAPSALEEEKESDGLEPLDNPKGRTIKDLIRLLLVDREVDVNVTDSTGWPLLFFALENLQVLKMLFQGRSEFAATFFTITAIAGDGSNAITWDAFTWAAARRCTESLTVLVKQLPVEAVQVKKEEIIRWFLAKDLTQTHIQENFLAVLNAFALPANEINIFLWEAVNANAPLAIQILLKAPNRNVNVPGCEGMTVLILAAREGHVEAISALLAAPDININAVDNHGETALIWAAYKGHAAAITALLAAPGINVNAVGDFGGTALMWAARYGHAAAITALLEARGIGVNGIGGAGWTALMWAAREGYPEAIRILLTAPTLDLTLHNQGVEAIALAERQNHHICAQLIQAALIPAEARMLQPVIVIVPPNENRDAYAANSNFLRETQREQGRRISILRFSQAAGNPIAEAANRSESIPLMFRQNPRL